MKDIKGISIDVKSDEKLLIGSGSFISFNDKRILFELHSEEGTLPIAFDFISNENDKESKKTAEVIDNCLVIKFYNYNETRFTIEPWEIGKLYGRKLFIHYYLEPLAKTKVRNITYSFYLGEEVTNG
ncbi:MAG: hypothetical protein PF481_07575 [Bacteroidales bacterium]|jgi:hypothetical protein|nr:hypothetical protein [Bacteroidales bacterium]